MMQDISDIGFETSNQPDHIIRSGEDSIVRDVKSIFDHDMINEFGKKVVATLALKKCDHSHCSWSNASISLLQEDSEAMHADFKRESPQKTECSVLHYSLASCMGCGTGARVGRNWSWLAFFVLPP